MVEIRCGAGSSWYDTTNVNLRCESNELETKCGTSWYDATNTNLRCQSNVVETRCGTGSSWYDATNVNLRCESNELETKCGTSWYDATNTNLRCQSNVVEIRCGTGSSWYDTTNVNLRCQSNVVETKCGTTEWYNATISTMEYCSNGTLKTYETVTIGEQIWMAENLNYAAEGSKCYSNLESNCDIYGRLYNWATAMALGTSCNSNSCSNLIDTKHKGICPEGWHIPSEAEWSILSSFVGNNESGKHLKSQEGWNSCGPSGSGKRHLCEDTYGFAALPGGYGYSGGSFINVDLYGYWWSANEYYGNYANGRNMLYYYEYAYLTSYYKDFMFSVRCVQDVRQ
jgi:uncharacterized protein (TIGR02145 family)